MTAIFRPPVAVAQAIGWRQVLGLAQDDSSFWARVRAHQLSAFDRNVPFNVALLVVDLAGLGWLLGGIEDVAVVLAWSAVIVALGLVWSVRRWRSYRLPEAGTATPRQFWLVSGEVAAFGAAWGALAVHLLPALATGDQMLLVLLSATTMGGFAFTAAMLPAGACTLVLEVALATLAGLPGWSPLATLPVVAVIATFGLLIARSVVAAGRAMITRLRTQAEQAEASAAVGMLLGEFETHGSDWLLEVDAHGRFTHVSPRLCEAAGRPAAALLGTPLVGLIGPDRGDAAVRGAIRAVGRQFAARTAFRDLVVPLTVCGQQRWWSLTATPRFCGDRFAGFRGVGSDVTAARSAAGRIAELARLDPLTGLANRALLRETIADALAGPGCAVLFVDLDRFRLVNESLGHLAGDAMLRRVAARLRRLAGPAATIGRLGGDEFAVVLSPPDTRAAAALAARIVRALGQPAAGDGGDQAIGASVGYAFGPHDGNTVDALLDAADLALDEVKLAGRGAARRFDRRMQARAAERRALEVDLAHALDRGELSLAYQPIVEAADERIVGFEALLRWQHPVLGAIPPARFIPVAEQTGAILSIGAWVLNAACAEAARWPADIRVAVNLSTLQFNDRGLAATVAAALADHGIAPDRLELEITESVFLSDRPSTAAMIARLRSLGVRFALDDFGTGYSALGYLRRNAFSRIKIDRSFIQRAGAHETESTAIIQAIVALANSLGMATTAEGTETRAEFEACRSLGCAQVQGYLFGRPMPAADAAMLVGLRAPA